MDVLRKIIIAALSIAVILGGIFTYIGISNRKEKEKVELVLVDYLNAIKEGDFEKVGQMTYHENNTTEETEEDTKLETTTSHFSDKIIKNLFKYMTYEMEIEDDVTIFDNEVDVDVRILNKNMTEVISKASTEMLKYTFSSLFNANSSQEEADKHYEELLLKALDDSEINYSNNHMHLKMVKVDKEWKVQIVDESEFMEAILPEMQEAIIKYKVDDLN